MLDKIPAWQNRILIHSQCIQLRKQKLGTYEQMKKNKKHRMTFRESFMFGPPFGTDRLPKGYESACQTLALPLHLATLRELHESRLNRHEAPKIKPYRHALILYLIFFQMRR